MIQFSHGSASILAFVHLPLWEIALKSTMAILLTVLACKLLHRQSAALRHRVWTLGLAASLVVPVIPHLLPEFELRLLPVTSKSSELATSDGVGSPDSPEGVGSPWTGSPQELPNDGIIPEPARDTQSSISVTREANQTAKTADELRDSFAATIRVGQVLGFCWLIGTVIGSTHFLISLTRQTRRLNRLQRIEDGDWDHSVSIAAKSLGIRPPKVTLASDGMGVPAVVGVLNPRLLIPRDWRKWTVAQRHCILLHELAHIKRRDIGTQLLGRLALLAYWFNPLMWHAVRQLRVEREFASDDCVVLAGQRPSDYAAELLRTLQCYRPVRTVTGLAMANSARLDQRVLAILDPMRRRDPVGARLAMILLAIVGVTCVALGGLSLTSQAVSADPPEDTRSTSPPKIVKPVWKENYTIEFPGTLPVSVMFSADGKVLLTGDTSGEVMALVFSNDEPGWRWKTKVEGSHAAVAFSADQKQVYATTKDGVRILDAAWGKEEARIEEKDSHPIAIGVFPNKTVVQTISRSQIVFGNARGYFVKSWVEGKLADTMGTIETNTIAQGAKPADEAAVPLAVDPKGRSAIMTGPIDVTGDVGGAKGKNVLWAYVCGDYDEGSPGNRVMAGHTDVVVSAAWAKTGDIAITGDASGRVLVWDTKTMKETARLELGGRVAALALSEDGTRAAAYVLGKQGAVFVWETANPKNDLEPIHTELADFAGPDAYASLSFSPDGKRLAGCAIDKKWLTRLGELVGKVRVWELAAEPSAQLPPRQLYSKSLPKGSSSRFVILNNHSMLMPSIKTGAVDFRSLADGGIQQRLVLGNFTIGKIKLSADRKWLAMEQHEPFDPTSTGTPKRDFDIGIWSMNRWAQKATIPKCLQLLDVASGGNAVAVVREPGIEIWDVSTAILLKSAPFKHTQIDAVAFSPNAKLLAISDRNDLVLWNWEENQHERIPLGRNVGSLAFSPDGHFLAEGPTPREGLQIRDVETRKVVKTLANGTKQSMNVPAMAYSQSGRVLIACDNMRLANEVTVSHRINLWDLDDGSLAHKLTVPHGLPQTLDTSPNGRYLGTMLEDGEEVILSVWRLDGQNLTREPDPRPPAAIQPD